MTTDNKANNSIDEKRLNEAKEKLACHIMPPGSGSHANDSNTATSPSGDSDASIPAGASCGFTPPHSGEVKLTQMTSAGG